MVAGLLLGEIQATSLDSLEIDAYENLYLFSYFTKEDRGLQLAVSTDGYDWTVLNHGAPLFKP